MPKWRFFSFFCVDTHTGEEPYKCKYTFVWHIWWTHLYDTFVWHICMTHLMDTFVWHIWWAHLYDTFYGVLWHPSYMTVSALRHFFPIYIYFFYIPRLRFHLIHLCFIFVKTAVWAGNLSWPGMSLSVFIQFHWMMNMYYYSVSWKCHILMHIITCSQLWLIRVI